MSLDYLSVRVTRVIEETADSRSLEFELPEALAERLRYRPGQFLTLRVPYQGGGCRAVTHCRARRCS